MTFVVMVLFYVVFIWHCEFQNGYCLFSRDNTKRSGLSEVGSMSGGTVQGLPPASQCISIESFEHEIKLAILVKTLSWRQVYLPCSSDVGHPESTWFIVSLLPQRSHAGEMTFPHLLRLSLVGRVFVMALRMNLATPLGRLNRSAFQLRSAFCNSQRRENSPCIARSHIWFQCRFW